VFTGVYYCDETAEVGRCHDVADIGMESDCLSAAACSAEQSWHQCSEHALASLDTACWCIVQERVAVVSF